MPPPPDISRRQFLKLAGVALGATLPEGLERLIVWGAGKGLTSPGVSDELVLKTLQLSEKASNSENPNFRPITEIINEAVDNYLTKKRNKVSYARGPS